MAAISHAPIPQRKILQKIGIFIKGVKTAAYLSLLEILNLHEEVFYSLHFFGGFRGFGPSLG
jgi:hypothetical protein